ncbi:cell division protein PerM [Leifsonia xyli]|uniref:cell division protein PerM n=1 Tax=Leifsonia xyli TaxID=1575 RepID=UPI003D6690C6
MGALGLRWRGHRPLSSLRSRSRTLAVPEVFRIVAPGAVRAGTAATAIVIGVSALILALLIFGNYGGIISLYEQLQTGVAGGAALTVGQLAVLPNIVVWIASWLVGPGFAIGTGSSVSPLGTELGPLPGLPLFGVIPHGGLAFGLVGLIVPLLAGFFAAVLLRSRVDAGAAMLDDLRSRILTAVGIGVVAGVQLGLLAWWSSGALGPGRLHDVGPNPWLVGALAAAEVAVAAFIGLIAPSPRSPGGIRR